MRPRTILQVAALFALASAACAQNANISQPVADIERLLAAEPLAITQAEISRPKASGDITLKAEISFGGAPPLRVKLRKAEPGADTFNNVPRYDLAAYELQKLFLEPQDYVIPPTALRMVPLADFAKYQANVSPTFHDVAQVLAVVQYWLDDVKVIEDVYDPDRFASDAVYARHIGQMNILTYLISHGDSNAGNFLIGRQEQGARVYSVDNGVAFNSTASDRGELWKVLRVKELPADAIERLRRITPEMLYQRLGVVAQWRLVNGSYVPEPPTANIGDARGVRRKGDILQMGLTRIEINGVQRLLRLLLAQVDRGAIHPVPAPGG
jgi:hypothetical protein